MLSDETQHRFCFLNNAREGTATCFAPVDHVAIAQAWVRCWQRQRCSLI
jgi:hypothetical protein